MLDMLPFACGQGDFSLESVPLVPVEAPGLGAPRLIEGNLSGVRAYLTLRKERESTSGSGEGDLLEPFCFVTRQDVLDGANVIEVEIAELQPVSSSLQAAVDLVYGKDGQQGKVTFMAGISLPAPAPNIAIQGRISSGRIVFDGPMRFLLSSDGAEELRTHLEAGNQLAVEIGRYVQCQDTLVDNAWNSYHALAPISNSDDLLQEDCKVLVCDAVVLKEWHGNQINSCLPPFAEKPGGKAKPIEPDAESFAWGFGQSSLSNIKVRLVSPLVPLWHPPSAPLKSIIELIPTRDLSPILPPLDSPRDFRAQVNAALMALAHVYHKHLQDSSVKSFPIPQKHKSLIFDLNRSGTYLSLRESFKTAIERIVRDQMTNGKDLISQPSLMIPHYSALYTNLLDLIHLEMSSVGSTDPQAKANLPLSPNESARLLRLALEYEDHGLWLRSDQSRSVSKSEELLTRARDIHRKRLIDLNNINVWIDAASFSIRTGDLSSGISCLHSALEIDPTSKDALIKMSLSSLESLIAARSHSADDSPLYAALAAAHSLIELSSEDDEALHWALLALIYTQDQSYHGANRSNISWMQCRQKLSKIERAGLASGMSPESSNGFFQVWSLAREMNLPLISQEVEPLVAILQQSGKALRDRVASAALETAFLHLTMTTQSEDLDLQRIIKEAKKAARLTSTTGSDRFAIFMVQADACRRMSMVDESILALQKAKCYAEGSRHILAVNLRLADTFLGLWELCSNPAACAYAKDTLSMSAISDQCIRLSPLSWCLLGLACQDDDTIASNFFQEANNIDPELPTPWVYLALIESRGQRWNESSAALARSFQLGVFDVSTLLAIAAQYESAGRLRQAADILEKAILNQGGNSDARQRLIHCHMQLKNVSRVLDLSGNADSEVTEQAMSLPVDDI